MIPEDIRRQMTRWKRRARNISSDIQAANLAGSRSKKRNLSVRKGSGDEVLDDSCPKKTKSAEDEFHSIQNMAVAAEQPYPE